MEYISDQKKCRLFLTAMSLSIPIVETTFLTGNYILEERQDPAFKGPERSNFPLLLLLCIRNQ